MQTWPAQYKEILKYAFLAVQVSCLFCFNRYTAYVETKYLKNKKQNLCLVNEEIKLKACMLNVRVFCKVLIMQKTLKLSC